MKSLTYALGALLLLSSCSKTRFIPAVNGAHPPANELGVYLFLPGDSLPASIKEVGQWVYEDRQGASDAEIISSLKKVAAKNGSNIVVLESISQTFSKQELKARMYYLEDLAAIRYHLNQMENQDSLKKCFCNVLHFFTYHKTLEFGYENRSELFINGKRVGSLAQRDFLILKTPEWQELSIHTALGDTLNLPPSSGQRYYIELYDPTESSVFFTGNGLAFQVRMGDPKLQIRKGILNRLRFDQYLMQMEQADD